METETLEAIADQLDSMQDAFDTLKDNCYQIEKALRSEIAKKKPRGK